MRHRWLVLGLVGLSSCWSIAPRSQQVWLRHHAATDVLDLVIADDGAAAAVNDEETVQATIDTLAAIARGRRRFLDWPFDVDLDGEFAEVRDDPRELFAQPLLEHEESIRVVASHLVIHPENHRLWLVQRWCVGNASLFLRRIDAHWNSRVLEKDAANAPKPEEGVASSYDPATDDPMFAHARSGSGWMRFEGPSIVITVPCSPTEAASFAELSGLERIGPEEWVGSRGESSTLHVTGAEICLRLDPATDGWIRLHKHDLERRYRTEVAERLARLGLATQADPEATIRALKSAE